MTRRAGDLTDNACGAEGPAKRQQRDPAHARDRRAERRIRSVIDCIPGMAFTSTPKGAPEIVNLRLAEYLGPTIGRPRGWLLTDALHPQDRHELVAAWASGVASRQPFEFELRLRRGDGGYEWLHLNTAPSYGSAGHVARWYSLVTEACVQHRPTRGRGRNRVPALQLDQLRPRLVSAAAIAHELNQPIAATIAHVAACRRWLELTPMRVDRAMLSADAASNAAVAAAQVVERTRALFQGSPLERSPTDLNGVIGHALSSLSEMLQRRSIVLVTSLQRNLPRVPADGVQIRQVLTNLVCNGVEAMDAVKGRPKLLKITSQCDDQSVRVEIHDQGVGLLQSESMHGPYGTRKATGMGIGLAICRSIIHAHRGRMWSTSGLPFGAVHGFSLGLNGGDPP